MGHGRGGEHDNDNDQTSIKMGPHLEIHVAELQPLSLAPLSPFLAAILMLPGSIEKVHRYYPLPTMYLEWR